MPERNHYDKGRDNESYTHFHDQCGGGFSFSYDEPLSDEHRDYIEKYFAGHDIALQFSQDGRSFIMR